MLELEGDFLSSVVEMQQGEMLVRGVLESGLRRMETKDAGTAERMDADLCQAECGLNNE